MDGSVFFQVCLKATERKATTGGRGYGVADRSYVEVRSTSPVYGPAVRGMRFFSSKTWGLATLHPYHRMVFLVLTLTQMRTDI